jgi:hypothetical protein
MRVLSGGRAGGAVERVRRPCHRTVASRSWTAGRVSPPTQGVFRLKPRECRGAMSEELAPAAPTSEPSWQWRNGSTEPGTRRQPSTIELGADPWTKQ